MTDPGYSGPVCIGVKDRARAGGPADRERAVRRSEKFPEQSFG